MGIIVAIFLFFLDGFLIFTVCQEGVCNTRWDAIECCIDYRKVGNKCVLCQNGFHGSGCKTPCPFEYYGEACREKCNCEDEQTCDPMTGCVYNVTGSTVIPGDTDTSLVLTAIETTPEKYPETREMTTESKEDSVNSIPWQYMYIPPLGVVLILLLAVLLVQCRRKHVAVTMSNDDGTLATNLQVALPVHSFYRIQEGSASEYAEIRECHAIYSDANEVSGIYNELSFSKSKAMRRLNEPVNAMYDTSQSCVMHNEAAAANEPQGHSSKGNTSNTDVKHADDL